MNSKAVSKIDEKGQILEVLLDDMLVMRRLVLRENRTVRLQTVLAFETYNVVMRRHKVNFHKVEINVLL